jgi:hypothetical protein
MNEPHTCDVCGAEIAAGLCANTCEGCQEDLLEGPKSWRESPMIRAALEERAPDGISVVHCARCGSATYYNDGSHCSCEHCNLDMDVDRLIEAGEVLTLADVFEAEADDPCLP